MNRLSMRFGAAMAVLAVGAVLLSGARAGAEGWGTIKGQVVFSSKEIPKPKEANVDKNKDHCLAKGPIYTNDLVVDAKTKGIRWALVWIMDPNDDPKKKPKPVPIHPALQAIKGPVTIDQPCCVFEPRVVGIREGQELIIKNSAPIAHNVSITGGALGPNINPLLPAGGQHSVKSIEARLFPIPFSCSIHPWMRGYIASFKHPYFTVTDEKGNFEIKNAPAGNFKLMVWHEKGFVIINPKNLRDRGKVITIKAQGTTDVGKIPFDPKDD